MAGTQCRRHSIGAVLAGARGYNEPIISPACCRWFFHAWNGPAAHQPWVVYMPLSTSHFSPEHARRFPLARGWVHGLSLAAVLGLSACSYVGSKMPGIESVVTPYKIDIVQGNVVTREQSEALRPGMAREQVRNLLGSPLLTSVFHADRWDYVFTFRRPGLPAQSRRVTVYFKDAVLERFEADELPSEAEFVASLDSSRKTGKIPVLEATDAQLKAFADSNAANAAKASPPPVVAAPAVSYPPLETPGAAK
jgi:outer membrane protein assembly factor BamE